MQIRNGELQRPFIQNESTNEPCSLSYPLIPGWLLATSPSDQETMGLLQHSQVQKIYNQLLKEAERFPQYNYRMYALRKIRDEFANCDAATEDKIPSILEKASAELERLKRMTTIASLYSQHKLVIETRESPRHAED